MTFNRPFVRNSLIMFLCGAVLLFAIVLSAVILISQTRNSFNRLVAERGVRSTASDLFSLLQDAETGQRGYLLTLDEAFLKPYEDAIKEIGDYRNRLSIAVTALPDHENDMSSLYGLIDAKLDEMKTTIAYARQGNLGDARRMVREGFGQQLMVNIRQQMQAIIDVSDHNIQDNITTQLEASDRLQLIIVAAGIAMLVVIGGAIYIIMRHIRSLTAARREVIELNEDLERRVAERTEDVVRANQEIQRYAYIVTHDLRAPLVNIMGFSSELETSLKQLQAYVLADGAPLSEQEIVDARNAAAQDVPEALAFIRSSTAKVDGLINAILKISRDGRRQLKPETIDLRDLVNTTLESQQHRIDEVDGIVDIEVPTMRIYGDRLSIEQIIGNLVDNAIKYRNRKRPLKVKVTAVRDGRTVEIAVADNGRGIESEDLERVFELFRRAGPQDQVGEGIGLAHVRSLARNLGGDIGVRSVPGEGSTFTLTIPADLSQVLRSTAA